MRIIRTDKTSILITQGKKHQSNLARRAAKEAADAPVQPAPQKQVILNIELECC